MNRSKIFKALLPLPLTLITLGCNPEKQTLFPTDNEGGYTIDKYESSDQSLSDSVLIFGKIESIQKKEPLPASFIKWACTTEISDNIGNYRMMVMRNLDVEFRLSARSMLYQEIRTKSIDFGNLDSLQIDFYLDLSNEVFSSCN
ncbi:hypothetical protein BFP97_19710 [Roseivirga sp. 4D4]|uniref:hypothetical protein n=1 Tax=Roseivirga sp. 4D4 TaxID=1889784 RepID=UPI000852A8BE|nr:hypothetical protein [Roseivirga sp. 4D4]OEK03606.1 hypothetical protein BFP97_19710 [Roseivirga sp. 4D4]